MIQLDKVSEFKVDKQNAIIAGVFSTLAQCYLIPRWALRCIALYVLIKLTFVAVVLYLAFAFMLRYPRWIETVLIRYRVARYDNAYSAIHSIITFTSLLVVFLAVVF